MKARGSQIGKFLSVKFIIYPNGNNLQSGEEKKRPCTMVLTFWPQESKLSVAQTKAFFPCTRLKMKFCLSDSYRYCNMITTACDLYTAPNHYLHHNLVIWTVLTSYKHSEKTSEYQLNDLLSI